MLNFRNVNILFALFILAWFILDSKFHYDAAVYGWILLVYVSVLFCGCYFIRLNYFFRSVCSGDRNKKEIALSFDDGPDESFTPAILDALKENEAEAIFFCIGKKIPGREEILQRITKEGHLIGNHSNSHHYFFDFFPAGKMREDLRQMNELVNEVTGLTPRFFRPPYGVTNPGLKKAVEEGEFAPIGWDLRSLDTVIRDENRLLKKVLRRVKPGSILLFHDTSETTVKILPRLIQELRQQGYLILRLDKLINLAPYA